MAEIPTTLGQRLTPQPAVSIPSYDPTVSARGAARVASIYEGVGGNLAQNLDAAGRNLHDAQQQQDASEYAAATSAFLTKKIGLDNQFEADPDYATAPARYREALGKLAGETAGGLSSPGAKRRFQQDSGLYAARGVASLEKDGRAKSTAARVDWMNESLASNQDAAVKARDETTKAGIQQATMAMIDNEVRLGNVSPGEGMRVKRTWAESYAKRSVELLPPSEQLAALLPGAAPVGADGKPGAVAQAPLPPQLPDDVGRAIDRGAANATDAGLLKRIAATESSGNPQAVNPQSGALGLFQFTPGTAKQYGVTDAADLRQSVSAAQKLLADNRTSLRAALGREPTDAEQYLAWQQGATGAAALLANPDRPAASVLTAVYGNSGKAEAAIQQNGGTVDMTSQQFTSLWAARFGGQPGATAADALTTPAGGWDFTKKTGTAVDFIPADVRAEMIGKAQAEVKQQQTEARQRIQAEVAIQYDDQKRNAFLTGRSDPAFKAQVMAAHPDATGAGYVQALDHEADVGSKFNLIKNQTAAQDDALVARAKAAAETPGAGSADAADTYKRVTAAIDAKRQDLDAEIKQDIKDSQTAGAEAINKNGADWAQTAGETGAVPDEARVAVADSGSEEAKAFLSKLEQAAQLGRDRQQMETQPQSADKAMLERYGIQAAATGPGSADLAAEAKAVTEAIGRKVDAIDKDPAGYFAGVSPALRSAWDAVDANPSDLGVAQTTAAMSVAAQRDYGIPADQIQPLPVNRAAQFAQTIMTAEPDKAMATIDQVRGMFGDEALKQVLGQKGVPSMAKFLAFADQPAQEPVRSAALAAMKIKPEELDKLVKARGYKDSDVSDAVSGVITPLVDTLGPGASAPYQDALSQITKYYVSQGLKPVVAANQAFSAFSAAYTFHGTYRVPTQVGGQPVDDQKVTDGLNAVMQGLDKFAIVPQAGGPAGAPADYAQKQTIAQLQHGGLRWVTNADDTGVIGTYDIDQNGLPGPAVKIATGRLELLFTDLASGKYGSVQPNQTGAKGRPGYPNYVPPKPTTAAPLPGQLLNLLTPPPAAAAPLSDLLLIPQPAMPQ